MNPALPLLAVLGVAGLLLALRRGKEIGLAWGAMAIAGMALLAPALSIPDGIPSPAATLAAVPPWQGTGDPAAGNPVLRDVTFQIQPWQLFARRELRAGRLPLWNPHQFSGTPFWSNGQSAPLFPLHLLFAALPLRLGFVLLPWLRLMIAGCGAWVLGRELGLSRPAALLAALTFSLSGMMVSFLLFPMGNALAMVPWVLWAVERKDILLLALTAGLQLLGGHPETCAHTALLATIYLLVRGASGSAWLRFAAGWIGAALLAAVQILPLVLLLPETSKWAAEGGGGHPPLGLLLQQPLRLVLPQLYGHPAEGTWWGPFNYSATAVYAGALALPLAAAGLARVRGDRRWLAVAAVLAFSLVAAYHMPGVRDVLGMLPVLGRAAQHRLIFGIELGLALLAGAGCDRWLEGKGRGIAAGAALVALLLAAAWLTVPKQQLGWTLGAAAVALAMTLSLKWSRERRWAWWPVLPAVALIDLLLAHGGILRAIPLGRLYPETGAVRFLQGQEGRVAGVGQALRPNAALVYGLFDARGDDPVKLERYEAVYRSFAPGDPVFFEPIRRWDDPWLDRLGVRWVVAGPSQEMPGWRLAYRGADARVYERPGALPLVRWTEGGGVLVDEGMTRPGFWKISWWTPRRSTLVVAETWDRGWRALAGGRPVPVVPVDGALLGVELGPGAGTLELRYRPAGLLPGAALSCLGFLAILPAFLLRRRRKGDDSPGLRDGSPGQGDHSPSGGNHFPAEGSSSPFEGRSSAVEGSDSPSRGSGPPVEGSPAPRRGDSSAIGGSHPPAEGNRPPAKGDRPSARGNAPEIRPTRPEDLPSLSALFADRFGHSLEPDEWEWKYRQLPGEARSFVAVQDGEVVAHAGALCLPARWQGGDAGIWQLVDFAGTTRRGGLRPALVDLGRALLHDLPREQDAPWIFGFPSERHFKLGQRVFGYHPLTEIEVLAGPIPEAEPVRIESSDSGGDWAGKIWERCALRGVLGVRRTDDFLRWRYWARPRRYYRFYKLTEGFAVFAFVGDEAWAAELWLPTREDMLAVAADLRASGLRTWKFFSSKPGSNPGLDLVPEGERRFVGCRGRTGGPDPSPLAAGFTYSMGDHDLT